jgi:uncharacterized protein (TIGR03437 family)
MNLRTLCCLCYALAASILLAKSAPGSCGTYPGNWVESLDLHQRFQRRLAASGKSIRAASLRRDADIGNIAVIESDDSIFGRRNPFNLDRSQVTFTPSATGYAYATTDGGFDQVAAGSGSPLTGIGDDDTRRVALPFVFKFYGVEYRELWVNSDGNLTFTTGDDTSTDRSIGRMSAGPPRIAPLFSDLDPTVPRASVRVTANADSFVVTWLTVPEYDTPNNPLNFQVRLAPDGKIAFAWDGAFPSAGIVGISPGDSVARPQLVGFKFGPAGSGDNMIAERFGDAQALDMVSAARRFYETHDDAYDYLAFFNTTNVGAGAGVLAFESTVRTNRRGIGDTAVEIGREYGSANRLQAVLNMGPVSNYPANPNSLNTNRLGTGDTGLTVFAHEIGHLFLAFSSIRDPNNPAARPMLGRQLFHWNFRFNSEASLLEGNRIRDDGPTANPRFVTTATVEGYAPLDQYLMGLRPAEEVPSTFLVQNASTTLIDPRVGVGFNGTRRDISVADLVAVDGPRIPDHTVEQRRYRLGMILIVPEGGSASPAVLAQLERYRDELELAFPRYTSNRAVMDVSLRRAVRLSIEPAAGALASATATIEVSIAQPATTPVTIAVRPVNGLVDGPSSITIPTGARTVSASYKTLAPGVELFRAEPANALDYMVTEARLNIAAPASLALKILSGNRQTATPGLPLPSPIVVKLTDANDLPYPNVRIAATGGAVTPASAITGANGQASFQWTPTDQPLNLLQFRIEGAAAPLAQAFALGKPAFTATSVLNAASFRPGVVSGSIATIFGANLGEPQVSVDGTRAQVFYADDQQINFAVPALTPTAATATVQVETSLGTAASVVPRLAVQPGIFFDAATGRAAAINRGSRIFELYATGLGNATAVTADAGGRPASVLFSGLAPGFVGLYQINIQVDPAVPTGEQSLSLTAGGVTSNAVKLPVAP